MTCEEVGGIWPGNVVEEFGKVSSRNDFLEREICRNAWFKRSESLASWHLEKDKNRLVLQKDENKCGRRAGAGNYTGIIPHFPYTCLER